MDLKQQNLATYRKNLGVAFTHEVALDFLFQALVSIEEVHSKGIVHRDIKPVMIF